jgi:hypothetical protein
MSADALPGAIGLGLVAGWLAAASPLPRTPAASIGVATALALVVAETAWLADGAAAWACAVALAAGLIVRGGMRLMSSNERGGDVRD